MRTITKEVKQQEIVTEEPKIDLSIFRKHGNSRTFSGWIIQKAKEARGNNNPEVVQMLGTIYKKYMEFQSSEKVRLESWKGKSSFIIKDTKDIIYVEKWQREDKDSQPRQLNFEIQKSELVRLLQAMGYLSNRNPEEILKSRDLGEYFFQENWKDIFNNRSKHCLYTIMLDVLDKKGFIKYRGGKIETKKLQISL